MIEFLTYDLKVAVLLRLCCRCVLLPCTKRLLWRFQRCHWLIPISMCLMCR